MRTPFGSPTLTGAPITAAASVACGSSEPSANGVTGAYGNTYLIDAGARRAVRLTGRRQCAAQGTGG